MKGMGKSKGGDYSRFHRESMNGHQPKIQHRFAPKSLAKANQQQFFWDQHQAASQSTPLSPTENLNLQVVALLTTMMKP